MARRRFQDPKPKRHGNWWTIVVRKDFYREGHLVRRRERVRLLPADRGEREARKMAAEYLRPMNLGQRPVGGAISYETFIDTIYLPLAKKELATTTYSRTEGILEDYLLPVFGRRCLHELNSLTLQTYLAGLDATKLSFASRDKIRDVLSASLRFAVKHGLIPLNPAKDLSVAPDRRGKRSHKPYLTPAQFDQLLLLMDEPYASMVYVAIWTGLRVSELAALKWEDIGEDSITIDERYCRGDWAAPKSEASNATIAVNPSVSERINRLKLLTVEGKGGGPGNKAIRRYKVVKSDGPTDLVFQSLRTGAPLRDNNILSRYIKPAARKLGLAFVNWRCLRTSHCVWLKLAGADVKDAQGQMRHARASTTLDIYMQFVPESQRKAVNRLSSLKTIQ